MGGVGKKLQRDYHHLGYRSYVKKHKRKMIKLKRNYTLLIGIGMIGDSNYIGIILSGLIQEVKQKKKPIQFFQFFIINKYIRTAHWVGHSLLK